MIFGTSTIGVSGLTLRFCCRRPSRYYAVTTPTSGCSVRMGCWFVARLRADYSNRAFSYGKPNSTLLENAIASITGLFHGATLSVDMLDGVCRRAFRRQRRRAQPISPRFGPADADYGCFAYISSVPARSFLSSLSYRLQIRPGGKPTH
jgi:hypothetical protein